ncbi:hypothetical protein QCA50_007698 [Cerrena zonata]|uniref:Histone acetyltransferase type B catalytic subunit n=1 Tax=Cerrena zonata TaxID=2478898 RepID=A0AAW0GG97_9APHY
MDAEEWTTYVNESFALSLVRAKADEESLSPEEAYDGFHPTFTYPIFGDEQKVYGYKGLRIEMKFASASLRQYFKVNYKERLPPSSAVDDIEAKLVEAGVLLPDHTKDEETFRKQIEDEAATFKPFGTKMNSYSRRISHELRPDAASNSSWDQKPSAGPTRKSPEPEPDEDLELVEFEIWHATWKTPGFKEYHRRMQLFILLYIEGGSYIKEEEDEWEFVILYEKRQRKHSPDVWTYHFVGYSTLFPFYCYPEKIRLRISQFVILPPYQQEGHGSALYSTIYQYVLTSPRIAELTVEDPAEVFEDLRDRNDLKMLLNHESFMREALGEHWGASTHGGPVRSRHNMSHHHTHHPPHHTHSSHSRRHGEGANGTKKGKLMPPTDKVWAGKWKGEFKIAQRQFQRLLEMLILKFIDDTDPVALKRYRIQVKDRVYRFNFEALTQLEQKERQAKLEETFQIIKKDYIRILNLIH